MKTVPTAADLMEYEKQQTRHIQAQSNTIRALIGALIQSAGMDYASSFANLHLHQEREVDMRSVLTFTQPKRILQSTCRSLGKEDPVMRMIAETGRFSSTSVFIVGAFTGSQKLGEGFGSSISMAEHRAATNALHNLYLHKRTFSKANLPSHSLDSMSKADFTQSYASLDWGLDNPVHSSRGRFDRLPGSL